MSAYAPHDSHVAVARRSSAIFHTVVGFAAIEFLYLLGTEAVYFLYDSIAEMTGSPAMQSGTPPEVLFNLSTFVILALVVCLVVWLTHSRGPRTLFGDMSRFWPDLRRATIGGLLAFIVVEMVMPVWWNGGADRQPFLSWLLYLPWALLVLLIQTTAEEMFYRGYLQQQIAARFESPIIWMTLPNLAFALVHWSNGIDSVDSVFYVVWAFLFGLAASDLVARTGSLGAAIGFHFANNIFAFVVVGVTDDIDSALALYLLPPFALDETIVVPQDLGSMWLPFAVDLAILGLAWLAVRVAVRR